MTFGRDAAIEEYVTRQLEKVVDCLDARFGVAWQVRMRTRYRSLAKPASDRGLADLEWKIAPPQEGDVLEHDYLVRVEDERRRIKVVHSNSDAGPLGPDDAHDIGTAIETTQLDDSPLNPNSLAVLVAGIIVTREPNTWGLS